MDTFPYVRTKLAHEVFELIKESKTLTRTALNSHYKAINNQKKLDALTYVIRSLLAYSHIQRHFDSESNTLTMWATGEVVGFAAMTTRISQDGIEDLLTQYLTKTTRTRGQPESAVESAVLEGSVSVKEVDTSSIAQNQEGSPWKFTNAPAQTPASAESEPSDVDTEDLEEAEAESTPKLKLPSQQTGSLKEIRDRKIAELNPKDSTYWHELGRIPELTLDQFIVMLAEGLPSFSQSMVETYVGPARARYVGARLAQAVARHLVVKFADSRSELLFCLPSRVPTGAAIFDSVTPQPKRERAPQSNWSTAGTLGTLRVPSLGEPVASLTRKGLSLLRENGTTILFTDAEKAELVSFVKDLNL